MDTAVSSKVTALTARMQLGSFDGHYDGRIHEIDDDGPILSIDLSRRSWENIYRLMQGCDRHFVHHHPLLKLPPTLILHLAGFRLILSLRKECIGAQSFSLPDVSTLKI